MRTKRIVEGLENSQKIRVIVNGFAYFTTVKQVTNIATTAHRQAVVDALTKIGLEKKTITGFGTNANGVDVQVDLVEDSTIVE